MFKYDTNIIYIYIYIYFKCVIVSWPSGTGSHYSTEFSVQNVSATVMSWAQLLQWTVRLSFASWASIIFAIIPLNCKVIISLLLLVSSLLWLLLLLLFYVIVVRADPFASQRQRVILRQAWVFERKTISRGLEKRGSPITRAIVQTMCRVDFLSGSDFPQLASIWSDCKRRDKG